MKKGQTTDDIAVVEIINLETKETTFIKAYKKEITGDAINRMMESMAKEKLERSKLAVKGVISVDEWKLKERLKLEQGEAVGAKTGVVITVATTIWCILAYLAYQWWMGVL